MVSLIIEKPGGTELTQFLAEDYHEERLLLDSVIDFLIRNKVDYLITYNGQNFDIPFLKNRIKHNGLSAKIFDFYNFDLYYFVKFKSNIRGKLKSYTQTSVESFYNLNKHRQDVINGKQSAELYKKYVITHDSIIEKIILTHNKEDVLQLYNLLPYIISDVENFDKSISEFGVPVPIELSTDNYSELNSKSKKLHQFPAIAFIAKPRLIKSKNLLKITGSMLTKKFDANIFTDFTSSVSATFDSDKSFFEITIPVSEYSGEFYVDLESAGLIDSNQISYKESLQSILNHPNYINGFLILDYESINLFSIALLQHLTDKY